MDLFANTTFPTTTLAPSQPIASYWGFIGLAITTVFFGSNYLPVKQYETGDGMFFQLVLCLAIWSVGFVVQCIRKFPQFYALPMLGGLIWTTGNINTVPIIKCIGLGMGMLFWGTVSLVLGWANARFGWFGLKPEVPSHTTMNYIGVALAAISTIFYLFVKTEANLQLNSSSEREPLIDENNTPNTEANIQIRGQDGASFFDNLEPKIKRILGTILAVTSGILYGVTYTPYLYVVDNYHNASQNGLDYVFSFYTGILSSSVVYFSVYCIVKKNRPQVNPKAIFPGMVSGWMWAIANCSYFVANSALSQAIAFPIAASGPPVIANLYGIFLYREIRGKKNFLILIFGFTFAIVGGILCGLSK